MLRQLKEKLNIEGLLEVTFISGDLPIEQQEKAFKGKVIFVDEAAQLDVDLIRKNISEESILILYYSSEEDVKERLDEDKWPKGSYTLMK